jgi:tetratricopeptide (TPR) repeat protein
MLALLLAVLLCYANGLGGAFQFDDYKVIVDNPAVQSWEAWSTREGQGILGLRPLLKVSYVLNVLSGWGVFGFHLVNLLIHLGNCLLAYALTGLLAQGWLKGSCTLAPAAQLPATTARIALTSALLFAVHPVHTEAVTYVCGRSSSLMALFYLVGIWASVSTLNDWQSARWARVRLYAMVPLCFVLALSVKETAVTFPLALLACDLWRGTGWRHMVRRQWPVWALLVAGVVYFLLNDVYLAQMRRSAEFNHLAGNVATQSMAFAYLMRQWVLPLWLNIDPDLPVLHTLPSAAGYVVGLCAVAVATRLCWRKRPWISFALVWAVIHLVPLYLVLPRLDVANDRQLYLAAWPLGMAVAVELALALPGARFRWTMGALVLGLGSLTVVRNQDYATEIALWESTVEQSPRKARVHNNLGYAYQLAGRVDDARREYTTTLQLDPQHIKTRYNLRRLDQP